MLPTSDGNVVVFIQVAINLGYRSKAYAGESGDQLATPFLYVSLYLSNAKAPTLLDRCAFFNSQILISTDVSDSLFLYFPEDSGSFCLEHFSLCLPSLPLIA